MKNKFSPLAHPSEPLFGSGGLIHASEIYFDFAIFFAAPSSSTFKVSAARLRSLQLFRCLFDEKITFSEGVWTMASRTIIHLSLLSVLRRR